MRDYYVASISFGKDSLAMLLRLIEEKYPLNEVIFYDTGMEFKAIYNIRDNIVKLLDSNNIKYTELSPQNDFFYDMLERPVKSRTTGLIHKYGYEWCGGTTRWGTSKKLQAIKKHCKNCYQYVGIAFDEIKRYEKSSYEGRLLPLVNWEMTEKDCLKYCYDRGYYWHEGKVRLYDILDRVSCWCCTNKNLKELKNIYKHLPEYWEKLKVLQFFIDRPFKTNGMSIFELEKRFQMEELQ
jgi:3'-phosphoadenosine 5'-phosphosulfate sulfotransferase (PAPS reductase)/FAD synthetase